MKIKIIQQMGNKFLIERYFKSEQTVDYVVCENYDRETNTYEKGIISLKLQDALLDFNNLVHDYDYYCRLFKYLDEREKKKIVIKDKKTTKEIKDKKEIKEEKKSA